MNQDVPRTNVIEEINSMIRGLSDYTNYDLSRKDDLGPINFEKVAPTVRKIINLFLELKECDFDCVPTDILIEIRNVGGELLSNIEEIKKFSFSESGPSNPAARREQISKPIFESYDEIYRKLSPVISYGRKRDLKSYEDEMNNNLKKIKDEANNMLKDMKSSLDEILLIEEKVKQAAQEGAVAAHSIHFRSAADEHKKAANIWLFVTGIFAFCAILFAYYNYAHFADITDRITPYQNIQLIVAKVIVFSLLLTGIVWSGRIYRANRHNYIINKHRHNALNTFETFVRSTEDAQIKAAVLLQTTQCIFSQQHSGYITQESETGGAPQILEIVRGIYGQQPKS